MKTKNGLILFLTAFIWGTAFVAQSVGMDYLGPFSFNGIRSLVGGLALIPCIAVLDRMDRKSEGEKNKKTLIIGGICGQQSAADRDTVYNGGKSGIYHCILYCAGSGVGNFPKEADWLESLGGSSAVSCGTVFLMYNRGFYHRKRRCICVLMRAALLDTYFGD